MYPSLSEVSEALWDKVIDVNLKGPFRLSAIVGERMAAGEGGSIINVSSIAGTRPSPVEVPYGAAKAGLENLTFSMSKAFGLGPLSLIFMVNASFPGEIRAAGVGQ